MATGADVITSIRAMIPDPAATPDADGGAFSAATLIIWINDAMRIMAQTAPIIQDWHALRSTQGMDVYELPTRILTIDQLWYDLWPCLRSPEAAALFNSKVTSRAFFFGPHSIHATPRLHVWPCADRTGATAQLNGLMNTNATSLAFVSATSAFKAYGFLQIDNEIMLYRTVTDTTISNILRGQCGTVTAAHNNGTAILELNIFFKGSRLPVPVTASDSVVEVPNGLVPLIELYALSKVREAEQDHQMSAALRQEFQKDLDKLAARANIPGIRQGLQVGVAPPGPLLYGGGRVYVP